MSCFIDLDLQVQCEFAIAGRLDVEPKLDIAHYHLIQLYINLMNFLAVTIFLATVPEVFCCCYLFLKTRKTTARFVLVDDKFGALTRLVQGMQIHCTPKMKKTQLCTNTWQNLHVNGKRHSTFHTGLASLCIPSPNKWKHSSLPFCLYGQLYL